MKTMAMAVPADRRCGIRDYADFLGQALQDHWYPLEIQLPESIETKAWQNAAVQADQADLVLVHYEYGLFHSVKPYRNLFARFMKRLQPPSIVILHDLLPELSPRWHNQDSYSLGDALRDLAYLPFFPTWSNRIYGSAGHYIVHSPQLRIRVRTITPRAGISYLQHPIPATSTQWNFEHPKKYTFISPGFIKPHKGYLEFLDVVRSMKEWTWLLAGGPQTDADREFAGRLQTRIGDLGLTGRVTISGYQPRPALEKMMTLAELAVFPYKQATGSGAAAWAIGMNMPILAAGLDSFKALVQDGAGLALLPDDEPEQWPGLTAGLLNDHDRQDRLVRCNTVFSAQHGYDAMARQITSIGTALLAQAELGEGENR